LASTALTLMCVGVQSLLGFAICGVYLGLQYVAFTWVCNLWRLLGFAICGVYLGLQSVAFTWVLILR